MTDGLELTVGLRLGAPEDSVTVIVLKAPTEPVVLTCGKQPMTTDLGNSPAAGGTSPADGGAKLGKRYVDVASGLEVLVTRGGSGPLAASGRELQVIAPKKLPSSD